MVAKDYRRTSGPTYRFLLLALVLCLPACEDQTAPTAANPPSGGLAAVRVVVNTSTPGPEIPADFLGLGFEMPVMADPHLRSDPVLEQLLRNLGPGTLRFGGNSVERMLWKPAAVSRVPLFQLTPADVNASFDFARRIGWRVTVTLPLTPTDSSTVNEAAYVVQHDADALLAVELGNEPNLFPLNGARSPGYTVDSFTTEFDAEAAAIRERAPQLPIAGPSTWCTGGGAWFDGFMNRTETSLAFTSLHFYPMGVPAPAGSEEAATVENMLSPALMARTSLCVDSAVVSARAHGLALRVDETNSAFGFGKPGVSDVFASALWGLDHLYTLAELGVAGVNLQTGTSINGGLSCSGIYLPLCTENGRWTARPLYYAMLLFHEGAIGHIVPVQPTEDLSVNLVAHATVSDDGVIRILLIHKEAGPGAEVTLDLGHPVQTATVLRLLAPSLVERDDIQLGGSQIGLDGNWAPSSLDTIPSEAGLLRVTVQPASAALVTVGR